MARYAWQVLVIGAVLGTILVAPTWETLFAAGVAAILNRVGQSDWRVDFGLRPIPWKHVLFTVLAGIALFFAVKLFLQPLCDLITHSTRNLHSFDRIRGQPQTATLLILKTMVLAGLCEEVIFRSTVQQRIRLLLEHVPGGTVLTIILASAIFTSFHWYQGPSGLLLVGVLALLDCSVYAATKYTLTYTVILHLVYDTLALAAIALNYDLILQRGALRLLRLS